MSAGHSHDVHKRIKSDANEVQANPLAFITKPDDFPALHALLVAATEVIEEAVPASFEYKGRRYWLRTRMMAATVGIYDKPTSIEPMVCVLTGGPALGHKPGH